MKIKPLRSPITWFGGKGCFRRKLYPLLPDHQAYVEPFGGGGSVLLGKDPAPIEVYNSGSTKKPSTAVANNGAVKPRPPGAVPGGLLFLVAH